jgi:hypothetical protein
LYRRPVLIGPKPPASTSSPAVRARPHTDPKAGIGGRNLIRRELFALIDYYAELNDLPSEVVRAIALQESSGRHWDKHGNVVSHDDGDSADWGVMQINDRKHGLRGLDLKRVKADERYNIEAGALKLRRAADYWFPRERGFRFTLDWYRSLPAKEKRAARLDLFRSYNGWLKGNVSNALPYERRVETGEVDADEVDAG